MHRQDREATSALHFGPILPTPHPMKTKIVTEPPTKKGPSSVVTRGSDIWRNGHGRRYWTARDPGDRLGNIAAPKKNWRQLKLSGGDMRRGWRQQPLQRRTEW
ncbi:uncharacterized protein ACWYII_008391 [Salvelinus alpinus]